MGYGIGSAPPQGKPDKNAKPPHGKPSKSKISKPGSPGQKPSMPGKPLKGKTP